MLSVQSARRQRRNDPMPRPSLELIADKRPMPSPIVVLRAVDRWLAHRPVRVLPSMRVAAGRGFEGCRRQGAFGGAALFRPSSEEDQAPLGGEDLFSARAGR